MKHPPWLVELHRQWLAARGKRLEGRSRPFSRDWHKLLDDAGIVSAEDIATAEREAQKLHDAGSISLVRHRYRPHLVEGLSLPVSSEAWLRSLFGSPVPEDLRRQSLDHVRKAAARRHPSFPESWRSWLGSIEAAFEAGRNIRPFFWQSPDLVHRLLDLTFALTSKEWPSGHLVREASTDLGLGSKELERSQRVLESMLSAMFERPMSFGLLGLVGSSPRIEIAGELILRFSDGRVQHINELQGTYHLTSDLHEAIKAETPARRILTVENSKTTLRRLAFLNGDKETLLLACAYPTAGLRRIIELLPADLPIHHFGDTDPAGYQILSKLRGAVARPVTPFLMERRDAARPVPLTDYDRAILPSLLADPLLEDVRHHLAAISSSKDKGDFEQESLGRPELGGWPFYKSCVGTP